jgi:hypothetical protein
MGIPQSVEYIRRPDTHPTAVTVDSSNLILRDAAIAIGGRRSSLAARRGRLTALLLAESGCALLNPPEWIDQLRPQVHMLRLNC